MVKDSATKELVQEVNIAHGQNHYALEHDEKKQFNLGLSIKGTVSFTVTFKVLGRSQQLPLPSKLPPAGAGALYLGAYWYKAGTVTLESVEAAGEALQQAAACAAS